MLGETTHTFSHVRWRMTVYLCTGEAAPQEGTCWAGPRGIGTADAAQSGAAHHCAAGVGGHLVVRGAALGARGRQRFRDPTFQRTR